LKASDDDRVEDELREEDRRCQDNDDKESHRRSVSHLRIEIARGPKSLRKTSDLCVCVSSGATVLAFARAPSDEVSMSVLL
jgi:hypothetical protein